MLYSFPNEVKIEKGRTCSNYTSKLRFNGEKPARKIIVTGQSIHDVLNNQHFIFLFPLLICASIVLVEMVD